MPADVARSFMELERIEARVARLRRELSGLRVGVSPADFGRFSRNMSGLLQGFDVRAIFLADPRAHDQGYPVMTDPDEFLDAVDVCLLWGLDEAAGRLFYAARGRATRFIHLLDRKEPWNLLWDRPDYVILDGLHLDPADPALTGLGISSALLERNFSRTEASERLLRGAAPERLPLKRSPFRPFAHSLVSTGRAFAVCPVCGRMLSTDEAYPVTWLGFGSLIFYRFHCHFEFHLLGGIYGEGLYGMYVPEAELLVRNHLGDDPTYAFGFRGELYAAMADRLKLCCLYMPELVRDYQMNSAPRLVQGLTGVIYHLGDHLNWEVTALARLARSGTLRQALDRVLVTRYDPYGVAELFPALRVESVLAPSEERVCTETFRRSLADNTFSLLPADVNPVSERLAQGIRRVARSRCPRALVRGLNAFRKAHRPILWVTLRSQRRVWRGQVEGLARVLNRLALECPQLGVIVDGAPAWERATLAELGARLEGVAVFDALDLRLHESVLAASCADFFIAPHGNGTNFTSLANIPGILHGPRRFLGLAPGRRGTAQQLPNPRQHGVPALVLAPVWDDDDEDRLNSGLYDLDVDELFGLVLDLARASLAVG